MRANLGACLQIAHMVCWFWDWLGFGEVLWGGDWVCWWVVGVFFKLFSVAIIH